MTDKTIDPLGTCQAIALSGNTRYYYLVHDFEIWNEYYDEKIDSNFARSLQNVQNNTPPSLIDPIELGIVVLRSHSAL